MVESIISHSRSASRESAARMASRTPHLDPAVIAALYGFVVAQSLRQIAPAPARAGHPEQRVQKPAIVGARTPLALPAAGHKLLKPLPLVVSKHVAIHRRSPKISVESDSRPFQNPRSLNRHRDLAASIVFAASAFVVFNEWN